MERNTNTAHKDGEERDRQINSDCCIKRVYIRERETKRRGWGDQERNTNTSHNDGKNKRERSGRERERERETDEDVD